MSITGVVGLFSGRPVHPIGADGRMALSDHLRELRARVLKAVLAVIVAFVVALFFFDQLFELVHGPYTDAMAVLEREQGVQGIASTSGAAGGFLLYLKLCGLASVILTSPYWLYQIWAFIMPGLHAHERRSSRIFVAIASPLFLLGVFLGYITLPKGLEILIGFVPEGLTSIVEFNDYLSFFSRTLLVFGIAFEIPVFCVLLNIAGVLKGKALGAYRPWIVIGSFIFAAVATPSGDPFTMTIMAVPMVLLFFLSEIIARLNDRRRDRNRPYAGLDPDQASPL